MPGKKSEGQTRAQSSAAAKPKAKATATTSDPFALLPKEDVRRKLKDQVHVHHGFVCATEPMGLPSPNNLSPFELVLHAPGFIPLWAPGSVLRYQFQEASLAKFKSPDATMKATRALLGEAVAAWGDAAPVNLAEIKDGPWDFEIVLAEADACSALGCVLASAFFPDSGRHKLNIYPKMYGQSHKEQVDTLIHEIGHMFGLRHFFAKVSETQWPAEIYGKHDPFSIMNYGNQSELTDYDRSDLKQLYAKAWSQELTQVNGTKIRFFKPYSAT